ncbi:MAG: VOC family protein [Robiginitomaculum sp.]|nr:VOC family protein [Robiginitomaculum sp.]
MIRLEHANLVVAEIEPSLDFLLSAFPHWRVRQKGKSTWYGKQRNWLHVGDDETYLTFNDSGEGKPRDLTGQSQGLAHLAFEISGIEDLIERLAQNGYTPRIALDGHGFRRNVYYLDGNGLEFEFVEYDSDDPAKRNASEEL